jgi:uncharacterized hydrophobic protein (TIGR00271 family)
MINNEFIRKFKSHLNLNLDLEDEKQILEDVAHGAELKGPNLWLLILAVVIASVGLNMNSTAVIIGAMLISPLMGPLIAIGLGLSINDFDLIKLAAKNLGFAIAASLLASTIYFFLTPLDQAQTEILARTSPTIFDVFISFAGGLAGMIAITRRTKGIVLPGVAIATALMPPLCTAGYGIASGNWQFFFGAFYLFLINCVFIFLGTYLIVKTMRLRKKVFVDKILEAKISRYIYAMTILTVLPSVYLAYSMINRSISERKINEFMANEITSSGLIILEKKTSNEDGITNIDISVLGPSVSEDLMKNINTKLKKYELDTYKVKIKNVASENTDVVAMKSAILHDLYKNNEQLLQDKDKKIELLERELASSYSKMVPIAAIKSELKAILPNMEELILSKTEVENDVQILLAYLSYSGDVKLADLEKTKAWLKIRTQSSEVKLLTDRKPKNILAVGKQTKLKKNLKKL